MSCAATIELTDLELAADIGTYGPNDTAPAAHLLDLKLSIDSGRVLIETDGMAHVFDYDPLIAEIDRLARDGHYETQERLMTRILHACAAEAEITHVEVRLRKRPIFGASGALGVRLAVDAEHLARMRRPSTRS